LTVCVAGVAVACRLRGYRRHLQKEEKQKEAEQEALDGWLQLDLDDVEEEDDEEQEEVFASGCAGAQHARAAEG
jgi:hypothetical protein